MKNHSLRARSSGAFREQTSRAAASEAIVRCPWRVRDDAGQASQDRLIRRLAVRSSDLEGCRQHVAELMPQNLPGLCVIDVHLLQVLNGLLTDDHFTRLYAHSAPASRCPQRLQAEPATCADLSAQAVKLALKHITTGSAGDGAMPVEAGQAHLQTATSFGVIPQLVAVCTWFWRHDSFERGCGVRYPRESSPDNGGVDCMDQRDPFDHDGVTKIIGSDGEAVRVDLHASSLPAQAMCVRSVLLRELGQHMPIYARVLARAWGFALSPLGLDRLPALSRAERLLIANLISSASAAWGQMSGPRGL